MMDDYRLRVLYDTYYSMVYRLAANRLYAYTGSSAEAQDVVQEVFLLAAQKDIHEHPNPGGWLAVTTNFICMNYHKVSTSNQKKLRKAADTMRVSKQQSLQVDLATADMTEDVDTKLTLQAALSPEDYRIIVEHYINGRSLADIADDMDISYVAIRVRIHRIRNRLKKEFINL